VEQTVTVVETRTDDAHCDRFDSIKCETWTDVAQCADMKVTGTDDAGYMPVHGKCLVELNTKKLKLCPKTAGWYQPPATLTPPVVAALRSLDAVPNTTASVLDGFNSRPFSRNHYIWCDHIPCIFGCTDAA